MIKFACTSCGRRLGVDDKFAGRRVKCTKCAAVNVVPAPDGEAAIPAPPSAGVKPPSKPKTSSAPAARNKPASALEPPPAAEDNFNPLADLLNQENKGDDGGARTYDVSPPAELAPAAPALPPVTRRAIPPPKRSSEPSRMATFLGPLAGIRGGLGALVTLVALALGIYRGVKSNQATDNFEKQIAESRQAMRDHGDDPEVMVLQSEKLADATEKLADAHSGDDAASMRVVAAFFRYINRGAKPYATAEKALRIAGYTSSAGLDSRDAIQERLALVQDYADANEQYDVVIHGLDKYMKEQIDKAGLGQATRQKLTEMFAGGATSARFIKAREVDRRLIACVRDALKLVQNNWGQWRNSPNNEPLFESDANAAEYNRLLKIAKDAADEKARLRAEAKDRS